MKPRISLIVVLVLLAAGGALHLADRPAPGDIAWVAGIVFTLVPLLVDVGRRALKLDFGVDAVALLAMAASLAFGEYLAGCVVALMLTGGNAIEAAAGRRATRELTALARRAPRLAHRREGDRVADIDVDHVEPGDLLVVFAGEVVPVDGMVDSSTATIDEQTITGEPLPVTKPPGSQLASGTINAGDAFEMRATRRSADSAYASIARMVADATARKAPFVRMADRYAGFFLPVTVVVAAAAWILSGDPVRALAVLVVATPCPLILAAPIALMSGVSRSARGGVIVKGADVIERLGQAGSVLIDKTGTLTVGTPTVDRIEIFDEQAGVGPDELVRMAASVDQLSPHVLAKSILDEADRRGLALDFPEDVTESPGSGIEGTVAGHKVAVGSSHWLTDRGYENARDVAEKFKEPPGPGWARILVGVDGRTVGALLLEDKPRPDAHKLVDQLAAVGVDQVEMVTGDVGEVAEEIAAGAGITTVHANCSPADKVQAVERSRQALAAGSRSNQGRSAVVMVGDGVNDAPALAAADVGIVMSDAGGTVASETADALVTDRQVTSVASAIRYGRRSLSIARQSVLVGMGLSFVAMGFAAVGLIPPVAGALLQEGIDLAVILNALRALR